MYVRPGPWPALCARGYLSREETAGKPCVWTYVRAYVRMCACVRAPEICFAHGVSRAMRMRSGCIIVIMHCFVEAPLCVCAGDKRNRVRSVTRWLRWGLGQEHYDFL